MQKQPPNSPKRTGAKPNPGSARDPLAGDILTWERAAAALP